MPEMEPHETFDGKGAFEIGDYPVTFEERGFTLYMFSPDLYDQIEKEAGSYGWLVTDFLERSFSVGNLFVRMDPQDRLGFKTDDGIVMQESLSFWDPDLYPQGLNSVRTVASHSIEVSSDSGNILMEQCNKFGLGERLDEAFERNLRASMKISEIQRNTEANLYLTKNGRYIKTRLFPRIKVQEQE